MLQGALVGLIVSVVMLLLQRRNAKKGTGLAGQLERVLVERHALTLPKAAEAVGQNTFLGRGQVALALNALASVGKVRIGTSASDEQTPPARRPRQPSRSLALALEKTEGEGVAQGRLEECPLVPVRA